MDRFIPLSVFCRFYFNTQSRAHITEEEIIFVSYKVKQLLKELSNG